MGGWKGGWMDEAITPYYTEMQVNGLPWVKFSQTLVIHAILLRNFCYVHILEITHFFIFLRFYLFIWESEQERAWVEGGAEREGEAESPMSREPDMGLGHDLSWRQTQLTEPPRAPLTIFMWHCKEYSIVWCSKFRKWGILLVICVTWCLYSSTCCGGRQCLLLKFYIHGHTCPHTYNSSIHSLSHWFHGVLELISDTYSKKY